MNCKPHDIAEFVFSVLGNLGCRVVCLEIDDSESADCGEPTWLVQPLEPIRNEDGDVTMSPGYAADRYLRPVRDLGDPDEVIRRVGVPGEFAHG